MNSEARRYAYWMKYWAVVYGMCCGMLSGGSLLAALWQHNDITRVLFVWIAACGAVFIIPARSQRNRWTKAFEKETQS